MEKRLYLEAARRFHHEDGNIEIDEAGVVSAQVRVLAQERERGLEDGAYVRAWIWVPRDEAYQIFREGGEETDDDTDGDG